MINKRTRLFSFVFVFLCFLIFQAACPSFSHASIMLRIMGVNPDDKLTQTVKLKAYLPAEVEPEDVLEKGDLEVKYDTQQGIYYVYKEYELGPKESVRREVEIRDIWSIPEEELEGLRQDTINTVELLENTQFHDRGIFLSEGIQNKLDDISRRQDVSVANPQKHISEYRDNMKFLESVKTDLILVRSLLAQAKPLPSIDVWRVFLSILIFLGLIGITLFLFWFKRAKLMKMEADAANEGPRTKSEEDEMLIQSAEKQENVSGEKKGYNSEDIEKMMENE